MRNRVFVFEKALTQCMRLLVLAAALLPVVASGAARGAAPIQRRPLSFDRRVRPFSEVEQFAPVPFDMNRVEQEDARRMARGGPFRFAYNRPVDITPEGYGLWEQVDSDTMMWRLEVTSPEALSLNLGFSEFELPDSAEMFIYSTDGNEVFGPFTSSDSKDGRFWTPVIDSADIVIELTVARLQAQQARLRLTSINHGYRAYSPTEKAKSVGQSGSCNVNVACPQGDPWRDQIRAAARYQVSGSAGSFTCTGTLVNNTAENGIPYMLTAFHCFDDLDSVPGDGAISGANEIAASMVVDWNFEATTCTGAVSGPSQYQMGSKFRAGNSESDFVLVELDKVPSPQCEVYYAGWDRRSVAPSAAVTIHHPSGDLKKISIESDPLTITSYGDSVTLPRNTHLRVSDWDVGTTEAGSSGCALFDPAGRIIGQLQGGDAACGNSRPDWFGRFYKSWTGGGTSATRLMDWLDPLASAPEYMDGRNGDSGLDIYEPDDSYDLAAEIMPGETQVRSIMPVGDVDWVKFALTEVSEVVIETSGASGDTRMWLYNDQLEEIDFDDDSGVNHFSRIERLCGVNALKPGTYYILIDEFNNNDAIEEYTLSFAVNGSVEGDITGDCAVDFTDLAVLANEWMECRTFGYDKLTAGDASAMDYFGRCVSISGDWAAVGAPYDGYDGTTSAGSVYLFEKIAGQWTQMVKIVNAAPVNYGFFGAAVEIEGDWLLIGARGAKDKGTDSGAAFIFHREGTTWVPQPKLTAIDGAASDFFGYAVAISGDFAMISSPYDDDLGSASGSVYVYRRNGSSWEFLQKLWASDGSSNDHFGWVISIDGNRAVVGAIHDDYGGNNTGSAYVFAYEQASGTWQQETKLVAADAVDDAAFGCAMDIVGESIVVGAKGAAGTVVVSGAAYVFERIDGTWTQRDKLIAADGKASEEFGASVAVDGDMIIAGTPGDGDNGNFAGAAYVFVRDGSGWSEQAKLSAFDGSANDVFGYAVSLDGRSLIVGASGDSDNGTSSGSAYAFEVGIEPSADLSGDGCVGVEDLAGIADAWLNRISR